MESHEVRHFFQTAPARIAGNPLLREPQLQGYQAARAHFASDLSDKWFVGTRAAQKIVKRVANRAQLTQDVTPHILRHTWATLALQKGMSLAAVQKILGHDRLATTAIYLNLTDAHIVEEFEAKW